jgi:hypothetical protein
MVFFEWESSLINQMNPSLKSKLSFFFGFWLLAFAAGDLQTHTRER